MSRFVKPFLVLMAMLPAVGLAQVPDPTRPPSAMGGTDTASGMALQSFDAGVQTVIVRKSGKSGALINGQYVEVGGKLGDKKVVKITETEVVLQGEGGREIMKTTPAIEKTPTAKPAAKRRTTGKTE